MGKEIEVAQSNSSQAWVGGVKRQRGRFKYWDGGQHSMWDMLPKKHS